MDLLEDVSPGDEVQPNRKCARCDENEREQGEEYCKDCLALKCDSCYEFHGDFPDSLSASLKTAGFEVLSGSGAINKLLEVLSGKRDGGDLNDHVEKEHKESNGQRHRERPC